MEAEKTYHHEDLREELIDEGIRLLDTEGYESFSMRKVARACGVSHTAPYRHFRDKDELIIAIAAKVHHQFNECLKAAVAKYPGDLHAQISEMGCAYIDFFMHNPSYLRLLFLSDLHKKLNMQFSDCHNLFEDPEQTFYDAVNRYASAENSVEKKHTDVQALALGAWGLVHGITILLVHGDFHYDGDYMELARKVIWKGASVMTGKKEPEE